MHEWLRTHVANRFAAFSGLAVSGTVPIREELLNELLADFLSADASSLAASGPPAGGLTSADVQGLKALVRRVTIRAESGVVRVDFEIGV